MTDKTNELKNCPFCGSADVTVDIFDGVNDDWKAKWNPEYVTELGDDFVIMCDKCGFTTGEYAEPEHIIERWNRRYDHAAAELRWIPVSERLPSVDDAKQWKSEQTGTFISPELEDYVAKLMSDYAMEVLARSGYFDGRDHKGE